LPPNHTKTKTTFKGETRAGENQDFNVVYVSMWCF